MAENSRGLRAIKSFLSFAIEGACFSLEMRSRGGALINGAVGIEALTESEIGVCLVGGEKIIFYGCGLKCVSFGNRCVEISGKIKEIRFE